MPEVFEGGGLDVVTQRPTLPQAFRDAMTEARRRERQRSRLVGAGVDQTRLPPAVFIDDSDPYTKRIGYGDTADLQHCPHIRDIVQARGSDGAAEGIEHSRGGIGGLFTGMAGGAAVYANWRAQQRGGKSSRRQFIADSAAGATGGGAAGSVADAPKTAHATTSTMLDDIADDYADVTEVNHYYDENGKLVFDQIIFWRWNPDKSSHHVMGWRFLKKTGQLPSRDYQRGGYCSIWHDGGTLRRVRSGSILETWTQFDPEVYDRQHVKMDQRPGLARWQPVKVKSSS